VTDSPNKRSDNANKEFVCTYNFDGSEWTLTIWAATREEAEMKLKAVGKGRVEGILGLEIGMEEVE
jgi:hypothetical protein